MKMHVLTVINGISRKEESSIIALRRHCRKHNRIFRCDLLYVMPANTSGDFVLNNNEDQEALTQTAKSELLRCAKLFACADSQQWIASGGTSQEAMVLAKKLQTKFILMTSVESASSINYSHCPQLPRFYPITDYVNVHCSSDENVAYLFDNETEVA